MDDGLSCFVMVLLALGPNTLSFSLLSSSGSLQSSSNTPHITLSEFGLEVIVA